MPNVIDDDDDDKFKGSADEEDDNDDCLAFFIGGSCSTIGALLAGQSTGHFECRSVWCLQAAVLKRIESTLDVGDNGDEVRLVVEQRIIFGTFSWYMSGLPPNDPGTSSSSESANSSPSLGTPSRVFLIGFN